MPLKDYDRWTERENCDLSAVICICQKSGYGAKSPVNRALSRIQQDLRKMAEKDGEESYNSVRVAFVYENEVSLGVKPFEVIDENTQISFMESYGRTEHNLAHVLFMGLILLEEAAREEEVPSIKRLYLVTDRRFPRREVNRILADEEDGEENPEANFREDAEDPGSLIIPRFADIYNETGMYLYKTRQAGDQKLEKLFTEVHIIGE